MHANGEKKRMQTQNSELYDRMDFDHVVRVHADGRITDEAGVYAPKLCTRTEKKNGCKHRTQSCTTEWISTTLCNGEFYTSEWTLLDGYSGQDGYSGPIMHDAEFIGGALERDILATPGVYVVIAAYWVNEEDTTDWTPEGWAVARLNESA
jgi:hypothetical protein